jgi:hypothetical protein
MNIFGLGLIILGITITILGLLMAIAPKIPFLGKLPGDLAFQVGNIKIFFPLVTCLLLSLILSFIFNIFISRK